MITKTVVLLLVFGDARSIRLFTLADANAARRDYVGWGIGEEKRGWVEGKEYERFGSV